MADSAKKTTDPVEEVLATSNDSRFSTVKKNTSDEIPSDSGPQLIEERGKPKETKEAI